MIDEVPMKLKNTSNVIIGDVSKIYVKGGTEARINCEVEGTPTPTITWYKVTPLHVV